MHGEAILTTQKDSKSLLYALLLLAITVYICMCVWVCVGIIYLFFSWKKSEKLSLDLLLSGCLGGCVFMEGKGIYISGTYILPWLIWRDMCIDDFLKIHEINISDFNEMK
jgi:hypothetical protein